MGLFRKKQEDRAAPYTIKLRRATYAKLGLIGERLGTNEGDTLDGIIDFALASYGSNAKNQPSGLNLASLITGETSGDTDILSELAKSLLPKLLEGNLGGSTPPGSTGSSQSGGSSADIDIAKKLRELGM